MYTWHDGIKYRLYFRVWMNNFHYYLDELFNTEEQAQQAGKDSGFSFSIETYEIED